MITNIYWSLWINYSLDNMMIYEPNNDDKIYYGIDS